MTPHPSTWLLLGCSPLHGTYRLCPLQGYPPWSQQVGPLGAFGWMTSVSITPPVIVGAKHPLSKPVGEKKLLSVYSPSSVPAFLPPFSLRWDAPCQAQDLIHLCVQTERGHFCHEVGWVEVPNGLCALAPRGSGSRSAPRRLGLGGGAPWAGRTQGLSPRLLAGGAWGTVIPCLLASASWAPVLSLPAMPALLGKFCLWGQCGFPSTRPQRCFLLPGLSVAPRNHPCGLG